MSLAVRTLDNDQARTLLKSEVHCSGPLPAFNAALIADHIRTLIWAPYLRASDSELRPVHTSRVFAALDRNARFLFPVERDGENAVSAQHSTYEFVRDQIERCGDIANIGNGYWMPGPVRVIRPSGAHAAIVIGGLPTGPLQRMLKRTILSVGPARYLAGEPITESDCREESVLDWLGATEPLALWTEQTLEWAATQLAPQAEIDDDSIEIYAPDLFHIRRRPGFWVAANEFHETEPKLRLLRPKTAARWSFDRPEYLGVFNSRAGRAQLSQAVRIPRDLAYRLRFGFDQKFGLPRAIRLRRAGDTYGLDLKFGLPEPESKVLGLTWRAAGPDSEEYFHGFALPAVNDVAAMLGIRVLQV